MEQGTAVAEGEGPSRTRSVFICVSRAAEGVRAGFPIDFRGRSLKSRLLHGPAAEPHGRRRRMWDERCGQARHSSRGALGCAAGSSTRTHACVRARARSLAARSHATTSRRRRVHALLTPQRDPAVTAASSYLESHLPPLRGRRIPYNGPLASRSLSFLDNTLGLQCVDDGRLRIERHRAVNRVQTSLGVATSKASCRH